MAKEIDNLNHPGSARGNPDIVEAGRGTRFQPGQSGNPSGRPSTKVLTEALRRNLASPIPAALVSELSQPSTATYADVIAARLIRLAADGNIAAIREVYERTEAKPPKEVVERRDFYDGQPTELVVTYEELEGNAADRAFREELLQLALHAEDETIKQAATDLQTLLQGKEKQFLKRIADGASARAEEIIP
ncbi:MAG TPA: DUF5681 domain-containing protein [Candidatus Sulfotelmatobacter sp.]|nr:DUF5681 domain-containing protein [Candidatus Sulfotelmatobacter sp.]